MFFVHINSFCDLLCNCSLPPFLHYCHYLLNLTFYSSLIQLVKDLLTSLPTMFSQSRETHSALGPALQAAFKLMSPTGGRVTVFQTQLPTLGAGALQSREDPNQRSSTKVRMTFYGIVSTIIISSSFRVCVVLAICLCWAVF